jgi:ArsR family metal-binding transcriptional regulator
MQLPRGVVEFVHEEESADLFIDFNKLDITCEQWHPGDEEWVAKAKVPIDLTPLMPCLNAAARRPEFYEDTPAVVWMHGDRKVAVRPHEIAVSHVADREDAAEEVGHVVDWLNDLWERRDEVEPLSEPKPLPPLMSVLKLLPMNNCGECGLPTCTAFAVNLIEADRRIEDCPFLASDAGAGSVEAMRKMGLE